MTKPRPPYVSMYRDRHRVIRWRFRRPGFPQSQTTLPFGSEAWWTWYAAANEGKRAPVGAERTKPGSFSALVVAYYSSSDWKMLAATTQTTYRGIIERFRAEHGDKPVAKLMPQHIKQLLDARADKPAAANNILRMLRILMRFAVDRNWRPDDPTANVRALRYRTDGFHTWSEAEISQFESVWAQGTRERLAFDLLLYTAQRSGDVRRMGPQHVRGGMVLVTQEKTGERLELPLHPVLDASLKALPAKHLTFLVTQLGEPFTAKGFGNWMSEAARKAGLPVGCSAHGLRKAAARRLADAGCTPHQIAAVTGHKTLKEVERYTKEAGQRGLAEAAFSRLAGTNTEQNLSNLANRSDKLGVK